jgi:hypothetical protein
MKEREIICKDANLIPHFTTDMIFRAKPKKFRYRGKRRMDARAGSRLVQKLAGRMSLNEGIVTLIVCKNIKLIIFLPVSHDPLQLFSCCPKKTPKAQSPF